MKLDEFYKAVNVDPELVAWNLEDGGGADDVTAVVKCLRDEQYVKFKLPAVIENDWETLRALALGELDTAPLYHVTRVVGYYARIENMNQSKIGEIKDRRKGDYAIV